MRKKIIKDANSALYRCRVREGAPAPANEFFRTSTLFLALSNNFPRALAPASLGNSLLRLWLQVPGCIHQFSLRRKSYQIAYLEGEEAKLDKIRGFHSTVIKFAYIRTFFERRRVAFYLILLASSTKREIEKSRQGGKPANLSFTFYFSCLAHMLEDINIEYIG